MKWQNLWSQFKQSRTYLILLGMSATIWFLFRVIPKPSRARYPCMQAAAPLMSTFVIYLLGVSATLFSFKKFKQSFQSARYLVAAGFLVATGLSAVFVFFHETGESFANPLATVDTAFPVPSNTPVGTAIGLFPGRVVWVHDKDATNEYYIPDAGSDDFWYDNLNTDEAVVHKMLAIAIARYAGKDNVGEAWDAIFKSFNKSHGRGEVGYTPGEKIAFKINLTNGYGANEERMDATPQLLNAILYQLVHVVGVAQADITLGDPYRPFSDTYKNIVMDAYPNVYYVDGAGGDGVHQTVPSTKEVLVFSDKEYKSTLPQQYLNATYVINIPCLKTHNEGGITLIAKNHQGSYLAKGNNPKDQYAILMHYSLPKNLTGSGQYRHTVDYMGHKQTGGKGLIYIIDGLWGGENWEGWIQKFKSDPFNDDYPNSLFVGQDPVALESVGFDVLFEENRVDDTKKGYPITLKTEIADYLKQCASSDYWATGITYDPEGDGTAMGSLGVFEHWNNATDRQYSRNLGTGAGIEMNYYLVDASTRLPNHPQASTVVAAPNPFSSYTEFHRPADVSDHSTLGIYNPEGKLVRSFVFGSQEVIAWDGCSADGSMLPNGLYIYNIRDRASQELLSGKVLLKR